MFMPLLLNISTAQGQSIKIEGRVVDENGKPIYRANIFLKGSLVGAVSSEDGSFFFYTNDTKYDTLWCTLLGYKDFKKRLSLRSNTHISLEIAMEEEAIAGNEVVVRASAFTSGDKKGVMLSSLDIIKTPGAAADVMWAVQTYPGVTQAEDGAGLFVRGGDASETVVILDGAYLYHPYRFESPNGGFFGTISPFLIKGINFSSGGYGVEYGNSISGVLAMELKDLPQRQKIYLDAGLANSAMRLELPIVNDKFGCTMSANYSNSEYLFRLNHHNIQFSKYPLSYDMSFNTSYNFSQSGTLKLFLFHESDELGAAVDKPGEQGFFTGSSRSTLANLAYKYLLAPNMLVNANAGISTYTKADNLVAFMLQENHLVYQGRVESRYTPQKTLTILTGMEYYRNDENLAGEIPIDELDLSTNAPTYHLDVDYSSTRLAAYHSWTYDFRDKSNYTAGVRYERDSKSKADFFDFRNSLNLHIVANWSVLFALGRYHQFPEPDYLDQYVGNPNLQPSSAWHYIGGLSWQKDETVFRAECYYKAYRDLIKNDSILNYTNDGIGYAKGIDLFFKTKWKTLSGRLSLSYLDTKRNWADAPYLAPTVYDIRYNLTLVAEYRFLPSWFIGANLRYASGKPYTSSRQTYNDARTPNYKRLDLSLNFIRSYFENNITIFYLAANNIFSFENIFGYHYSEDYSSRTAITSSMSRSYYFGVQFSF